MSLPKFTAMLHKIHAIHPVQMIAVKALTSSVWQVEIKFKTNSVSDIFNINLYASVEQRKSGPVLVVSTNRLELPRTDGVSVQTLAQILGAIGSSKTYSVPKKRETVANISRLIGASLYTWAGTVW